MAGPVSTFKLNKQPVLTIASAQDVVNFRDCALECVNTDHVLSEIIADANEEKCV